MNRTLLLLLLAALVAMSAMTAAFANGRAKGERPAVTAEPEVMAPAPAPAAPGAPPEMPAPAPVAAAPEACPPPTATTGQAVGVITCGTNAPFAMAMNPAIRAEGNDVYVVAGGTIFWFDRTMCPKGRASLSLAACPPAGGVSAVVGTPALAIADQDVYVVAGNLIARFDRGLRPIAHAALPIPAGTAMAVTSGQVVNTTAPACPDTSQTGATAAPAGATLSTGMTMNPAIRVENQDIYVVALGWVFRFDRNLCLKRQACLPVGNCAAVALPPGQTVSPATLNAVATALGTPAITVLDQDVYIVSGTMVARFDRDLNAVTHAELPFPAGVAIALLPGGAIGFAQMTTCPTVAGYVSQPCPAPCPTAAAPTCEQPCAVPAPAPCPTAALPTCEQPCGTPTCATCATPTVAGFCATPSAPTGPRWTASLDGDPLQVSTYASGRSDAWLSADGQTLYYDIYARNIWNVTFAQLQLVGPGVCLPNAPVVATLITMHPSSLAINGGRVVRCSITACDLTGPFRGQPLSVLANAMNAGQIAVNVGTTRHSCGEIAGTLAAVCK